MLNGRALTGIELAENTPVADDVTICLKCGASAMFRADLTLRACNLKELLALSLDRDFMRVKGIVDSLIAGRKSHG
jgi:ribosomal protein L40E